jgi:hypothetical protein
MAEIYTTIQYLKRNESSLKQYTIYFELKLLALPTVAYQTDSLCITITHGTP